MLERILPAGKQNRARIAGEEVILFRDAGGPGKTIHSVGNLQACDGTAQQRRNVGMTVMSHFRGRLPHAVIRTGSLALGRSNEQIVALHSESAGIPVSGNETKQKVLACEVFPRLKLLGSIEDGNRIERRVRDKQPPAVRRKGKRSRIRPMWFLLWKPGRKMNFGRDSSSRRNSSNPHGRYHVRIRQRNIECLLVWTQNKRRWMRTRSQRIVGPLKVDPSRDLATP